MQNPKLLRSHPKPPISTMTGGLLPELILNILSRLPSKILCRFKCVCKDFLLLISSDSQFKDLHRSRSLKSPSLLQYDLSISDGSDGLESKYKLSQAAFDFISGQECNKFELEVSKSPISFIQVTSCGELVCIYTDRQILVLNPSTHQFISLAVENEILLNCVGIGYVDSCKEYKVVRINCTRSRLILLHHDQGCQVYSLKDGSQDYTVSTQSFEGKLQDNLCVNRMAELLPICVDGIFYWMTVTWPYAKKMVVCYLNLKDNSYGNYPFPEWDKVGRDEMGASMAKLVELQGYLCIQCSSLMSTGFLVYALKDTKLGMWEQVYNIPYPPGIGNRSLPRRDTDTMEFLSYMPATSPIAPQVLGFLPLNHSGFGVPDYVVSQYFGDETSRVHIVENGTIKTTADIRFSPRKTRRLLYSEGLFSFKSS